MSVFDKPIFDYGGIGSWIVNPIGNLIHFIDSKEQRESTVSSLRNLRDQAHNRIQELWDDYTGKSQVEMQNQYNRELAEEEYQRNLQSIGDTASAYEAAGFNRNLMYSQGVQSYQAPNLQAYSGSSKIDTILSRVGKVLQFIPAMYQATAALESIDQAREKTKQSEIRTMSMGMSLLDQGYRQGINYFSLPFAPELYPNMFSNKRHFTGVTSEDFRPAIYNDRALEFNRYADAALKNTFDNLAAIGISNDLRNTRNSYLGYQYDLDRRFGAAGRIVGMASQGLGAASKFLPLNKFFRR